MQQVSITYLSFIIEIFLYTLISNSQFLSPPTWQLPFYFFDSMSSTILDTTYKWNHEVFLLL